MISIYIITFEIVLPWGQRVVASETAHWNESASPRELYLSDEESQLNVTVNDLCNVTSVTINLSPIGGLPIQPMTNIEGNVWSVLMQCILRDTW
ncbi:MAG: hypothetical protein ACXQTD_09145 [Candidatus Syntropharchaeia archaeon]